nr:VOC family protein [Paracoccus saliphilus]
MSRFLGPIRQLGFVVFDIEQAMTHWTEVIGVGPFFYNPQVPIEDYRFDGASYQPRNSVALANAGYIQVELIQCRNAVPSCYKEFTDAGNLGLQHTAYWTGDYDRDLEVMHDQGFRVRMSGKVGENGRFAYFDREAHPGTCIELSEVKGPKGRMFDMIRAASEGWDGTDPVRPFPDLAKI